MHLKRDAYIGWFAVVACLLLTLATGCQQQKGSQAPPPPPSQNQNNVGSLQKAYSAPSTATGSKNAASGNLAPVTRWDAKIDKKTPMFGNRDAIVTLVEFSDFQCPFCSKAGKKIKDLFKDKDLKGKIRVFFKNFPLDFHKDAHLAAQASLAAHAQGKFWQMHDLLFKTQKLKRANLDAYAKQLKLNMKKFKLALDKKIYKAQVDADMEAGSKIKVSGTPTIFINGRKGSIKDLKKTILEEIKRNKKLIDQGLAGDELYSRLLEGAKLEEMKVFDIFVGDAPSKGNDDAPVTVVAFGDFKCGSFPNKASTILQLVKAYKGKVRIAFKHYPHHPLAKEVSRAAAAANELGMFWQYYDKLLANLKKLDRNALIRYAQELGIDKEVFTNRMKRPSVIAVVDANTKQAEGIGLKNTVGFYVNGIRIQGSSFSAFQKIINKILLKKGYKEADLPKGPPPAKLNLTKTPIKGNKNAPVTIVEFSDFQCPFCAKQLATIRQIMTAYKDKVRIGFKNFPLSFHKQAKNAAIASLAAHKQGKFWPYHDLLFRSGKELKQGRPTLIRLAQKLKLNMAQFKADLNSVKLQNQVEADMSEGARVRVSGTPTFYVNGQKLEAGGSFKSLSKEINQILVKKGYKASDLPTEPPPVKIDLGDSPFKGGKNAAVTIVEFSDFQCPFCSRGAKLISQLSKAYKKKIKIVFKQYPLSFHKDAHLAAQASLAAHAQGKFWQMHDLLFQNNRTLKRNHLEQYAQQLSMDMGQFKAALDSGKYKAKVNAEMAYGTEIGVGGTPTFFINNKKHSGKLDFATFQKAINAILLKKGYKASDLPKGVPTVKINIGNAPFKGGTNAKVTIVEFSDFQCPFCSRGAKTLGEFAKAYGNKVKLVFKQFPLNFHKNAHLAAQASLAAHAQGKFWEYHDLLFANQRSLKKNHLISYAQRLSMDLSQFKAALNSGRYKGQVDADIRQGGEVGVGGTPTVFINNKKFAGSLSFAGLMKVVNPLLIKAGLPASSLPQSAPAIKIEIGHSPSKGPANAPVTIIEFSDFQCPFCGRATRPVAQIKRAYGKKVRVVFKQFPLNFHKNAYLAAQAALAANAQGKFWEMHDLLFQNTRTLKRKNLELYAQKLKLNMIQFKQALDNKTYKAQVDQEIQQGRKVGVNGTPTLYVNGQKLLASVSFKTFRALIDPILLKKGYKKSDLPTGPPPVQIKLHGGEAQKGGANAPVTIIEFSDFQCPFCSRGSRTVEKVVKAYGDKVKLIFKHYPLSFHKNAPLAAQAAMAAQAQGKFWEMHDLLFANGRKLQRPNLDTYAKQLSLDMGQFKKALDSQMYKPVLDADMKEASSVGVSGTPCFFINGQKISGAQPFGKFMGIINKILLKKGFKASDLPSGPPPVKIEVGNAPSKGNANAPVTIVEFSDFQCPFCSSAAALIPKIIKALPGKVRVVFKQFPLNFHKNAHLAAQAALAAHAQGKFWKMHDVLFANARKLQKHHLISYASALGLDMGSFKEALNSGTYKAQVNADMRQGGSIGVSGTPSFYINGRAYKGRNNLAGFKKTIQAELKRLKK